MQMVEAENTDDSDDDYDDDEESYSGYYRFIVSPYMYKIEIFRYKHKILRERIYSLVW